jgi:hypothetical protein
MTLYGWKMVMAEQTMDTTKTGRKPKIAIGFFGITRSLKWTLPSIQENIIQPARQLGEVKLFAHLYQQTHIANPRSGEDELLDPEEYRLLECDEVTLEAPGACLEEARYDWILSHGDAFHDGGKSLSNLIHQLHSLHVVGKMIDAWQPDVVIMVRPDLKYHDSLKKYISDQLRRADCFISVPNWQWFGGVNDRLAIGSRRSCSLYARRIELIPNYLRKYKNKRPLPAERFLRYSLNVFGVIPMPISIRASRARANGRIAKENFKAISLSKKIRRLIESYFFWVIQK